MPEVQRASSTLHVGGQSRRCYLKAPSLASYNEKEPIQVGGEDLTSAEHLILNFSDTMAHPVLEFINTLLHVEIISIFTDCFFWLGVFLIGFPVAAVVALLRMVYQIIYFFIGHSNINPRAKAQEELAVFITGCDTGE